MSDIGLRFRINEQTKGTRAPDVVDKLFTNIYMCSVPAFQSRTIEDISQNGVYVTGIPSIDNETKNEDFRKYMTIPQMVDLYKRGVPIRVLRYKDTKDIYETVQTHLVQWLEVIRTGMNISNAPIEDLIHLDRFANSVYEHAQFLITPEALESALGNQISKHLRVNVNNFFENASKGTSSNDKGVTRINPIDETNQNKPPERESLADAFKSSVRSLRKY